MLRLTLFRHAKADRPVDVVDHDRPLSITGHKQARKMGEFIDAHQLASDLAIISTARRAQETWAEARHASTINTVENIETRLYEASVDELLEVIAEQGTKPDSLMLVGHNPGMERLTAWLIGGGNDTALERWQQGFVVGALAVVALPAVSWSELKAHSGQLERFETPDTV